MAKHRSHSIEFKRQIAQEFIAGETQHALASPRVLHMAPHYVTGDMANGTAGHDRARPKPPCPFHNLSLCELKLYMLHTSKSYARCSHTYRLQNSAGPAGARLPMRSKSCGQDLGLDEICAPASK